MSSYSYFPHRDNNYRNKYDRTIAIVYWAINTAIKSTVGVLELCNDSPSATGESTYFGGDGVRNMTGRSPYHLTEMDLGSFVCSIILERCYYNTLPLPHRLLLSSVGLLMVYQTQ